MEKSFVVLTNPRNKKLVETAPREFYASLKQLFQETFSHQNTNCVFHPIFSEDKIHVFENGDYIGWLHVVEEGKYHDPKISTQH